MVDDDADLKDSVQRLHRYIVDALSRRGDPYATAVTVSEIYQTLAPYRTVRSALGFEMNADYEHALVRLLSGLDGLTRLEPSQARDRLRKELESPNPDVTLYREYAACDVVLNPPSPQVDWVREQLDEDVQMVLYSDDLDEEDETQDAEESHATYDTWTNSADAQADAEPQLEADSTSAANDGVEMRRSATCGYCDAELPSARRLRFCPFCGADQTMQPCGGCGEPLDPEWAFCIACGTAVASGTDT